MEGGTRERDTRPRAHERAARERESGQHHRQPPARETDHTEMCNDTWLSLALVTILQYRCKYTYDVPLYRCSDVSIFLMRPSSIR